MEVVYKFRDSEIVMEGIPKTNWKRIENNSEIPFCTVVSDNMKWYFQTQEIISKEIRGSFEWYYLKENVFVLFEKDNNLVKWVTFTETEDTFQMDLEYMKEKIHSTGILEELLQKIFHPNRLAKFVLSLKEYYGIPIDDIGEYLDTLM